jgi:hypothetical protein
MYTFFLISLIVNVPKDGILKMLSQKSQLNDSYHIIYLKTIRVKTIDSFPITQTQHCRVELWNTPKKSRCDVYILPELSSDFSTQKRNITCENCVRNGYWISTTVNPNLADSPHVVNFRDLKQLRVDSQSTRFDWRFFGLVNTHQAGYLTNNSSVLLKEICNSSSCVFSNSKDSPDILELQKKSGQTLFNAVFTASTDFHPSKMTTTYKQDSHDLIQTSDITWGKINNITFYPQTFAHKKYQSGTETLSEKIEIHLADFINPVDDSVFTLEGMNLNDGQFIGYPELKRVDYPRWKNNKIDLSYTLDMHNADAFAEGKIALPPEVPNKSFSQQKPPEQSGNYEPPASSKLPLVIGIVTGVLALLALGYSVIQRRRRVTA